MSDTIQVIGITAGYALRILLVEPRGAKVRDGWLRKKDGTTPTVGEAIEYLETLDPGEVLNRKEK